MFGTVLWVSFLHAHKVSMVILLHQARELKVAQTRSIHHAHGVTNQKEGFATIALNQVFKRGAFVRFNALTLVQRLWAHFKISTQCLLVYETDP